jgi:hypothetical protein
MILVGEYVQWNTPYKLLLNQAINSDQNRISRFLNRREAVFLLR